MGEASVRAVSDSPLTWRGDAVGDRAGAGLAAGDLDADGAGDILVGAYLVDGADENCGRVYALPAGAAGGQLSEVATGSWTGTWPGEQAGQAVAVGDLDRDGVSDLVVGSPGHDGLFHGGGVVRVLMSASAHDRGGLLGSELVSSGYGYNLGRAVVVSEDLTDDGYPDVVVGAPQTDPSGGNAPGALVVWTGGRDGPTSMSMDEAHLLEDASDPDDLLGASLDRADGYDEAAAVVAGAPGADGGAGAAYLIEASRGGYRDLRDKAERRFTGPAGSALGSAVAGGVDLDADGYTDLALGAPGTEGGAVYVVYGPATSGPVEEASVSRAGVTSAKADHALGTAITLVEGLADDERPALVVAGVPGGGDPGTAWVFYGPVSGALSVADADLTLGWDQGFQAERLLGTDASGDEVVDLVIGVPYADDHAGGVLVWPG